MSQDVFDLRATQQVIRAALATMDAQVADAVEHLADVEAAMERLETAGMYPASPSREAWERRNSSPPVYLYLYWGKGRGGAYEGPDGKRKVYVGCDPEKIADARRMVENRRRWEALNRVRGRLESWLESFAYRVSSFTGTATSLVERSGNFPSADLGEFAPADLASLLETAEEDLARQQGAS